VEVWEGEVVRGLESIRRSRGRVVRRVRIFECMAERAGAAGGTPGVIRPVRIVLFRDADDDCPGVLASALLGFPLEGAFPGQHLVRRVSAEIEVGCGTSGPPRRGRSIPH
jgi:hypothetical protein